MWYLFLQIWVWLIVAFALGWVSHWFLCCRGNQSGRENTAAARLPERDKANAGDPIANGVDAGESGSNSSD